MPNLKEIREKIPKLPAFFLLAISLLGIASCENWQETPTQGESPRPPATQYQEADPSTPEPFTSKKEAPAPPNYPYAPTP